MQNITYDKITKEDIESLLKSIGIIKMGKQNHYKGLDIEVRYYLDGAKWCIYILREKEHDIDFSKVLFRYSHKLHAKVSGYLNNGKQVELKKLGQLIIDVCEKLRDIKALISTSAKVIQVS